MSVTPEIKEEHIIPATVAVVCKRLLTKGLLDSREVFLNVLIANPDSEDAELKLLFRLELDNIVLKYLTTMN
jgi:hypothetical protein